METTLKAILPLTRSGAGRTTLIAVASAVVCASAAAQGFEFGGYLRAGPGATTTQGVSRACYGLPGPGLKYRLGNECDIYGEFALSQGFKAEGLEYKALVMPFLYNPQTDTGDSKVGVAQLYVVGKGFDFAPGSSFWIGKRYYGRSDAYIVDTKPTVMDGVGAGVTDIAVGPGKLAFAYFSSDLDNTKPANRLNAELYDLAVNPGGKLRLVGTYSSGRFSGSKSGAALTLQHNQDIRRIGAVQQKDVIEELDEGGNTLWLQYAQGSANLNGSVGDLAADSRTRSWRIFESLSWQRGPFGGQAIAMWAQHRAPDATTGEIQKTRDLSLGGRVSYALMKNFKLVAELGHSQIKPDGQDTQKLTKVTFAPTLSTGPGFWNRPELRLYVTHAKWSGVAGSVVTGSSVFDSKTSGTSYGAQAEIWF